MIFTSTRETKDKAQLGNKTQRGNKKALTKSIVSLNRPVLDTMRHRNYSPISTRSNNSGTLGGTQRQKIKRGS